MEELIFECETITPMFLAGADGRTPELRAPSIKGAIRFWWRAMHPNLGLHDLKKKEAEIFGGSGEGEGQRSNIIITIEKGPDYKEIYKNFKKPQNSFYKRENNEIKYSPVPHKNNGNSFPIPCFPANVDFTIKIKLMKEIKIKDNNFFDLEALKTLFLLVSILGGLGKRSRRGFGSFKIKKINGKEFSDEITEEYITKKINDINPNWNNPNLDSKYPYIKVIKIGKANTSYEDLLSKIGKASHEYDCYYTGFAEGKHRLSSPVYVSITKINSYFIPIITKLKLESNEDLSKKKYKFPKKIDNINNYLEKLTEEEKNVFKRIYKNNTINIPKNFSKYYILNKAFKNSKYDKNDDKRENFIKEIIEYENK